MKTSVVGIARVLARNWSNLVLAAFLLLIGVPVYQDWSMQREKKASLERIGSDASIAGSMLWSAHESCSRIGVPDLTSCASYKGQLLQEMAAPALAKIALEHWASYDSNCQRHHTVEYCRNLLNRAFQLSAVAPSSRGNED